MAHFVLRNPECLRDLTNGGDAFDDPDFGAVTFLAEGLAELKAYSKYCFREEDFRLAYKTLKKIGGG